MKWIEIKNKRPSYGQFIWVWDMDRHYKILVKYLGSEELWFETKLNTKFPIWAYLNDEDEIE